MASETAMTGPRRSKELYAAAVRRMADDMLAWQCQFDEQFFHDVIPDDAKRDIVNAHTTAATIERKLRALATKLDGVADPTDLTTIPF
jgi:hypothetical protein